MWLVLLNFINAGGEQNLLAGSKQEVKTKKMAEDKRLLIPQPFRTFRNYGKV